MDELKRRVDGALQRVVQVLGVERQAKFPSELPHAYEDKFALAELATQAAIAGQQNVFAALLPGWPEQLPWLLERAAGQAVRLRFSARERCTLERQERRVLEQPHVNRGESWFQDSVQTVLLAFVGQEHKVVREDFWRVSVEWEICAYAGSDPADSAAARVLDQGQGWREIKVVSDPSAESVAPRPGATVVPPMEVDLTWLLRLLAGPAPHFRIDRSVGSCRTPSRNEEVAAALRHFVEVQRWAADVRAWLQDALLSGMVMPQGSLNRIERLSEPMEFVDTDGDVNRLAMEGLQLVWYEPDGSGGWQRWANGPFSFDMSTGELEGRLAHRAGASSPAHGRALLPEAARERLLRCALGGSLGLQQADSASGCGSDALPLVLAVFALEQCEAPRASAFSAEDLGRLAAEHARAIVAGLDALQEAYPEASGQLPGARLAACLRFMTELSEQQVRAVDVVEAMLRRQLVAALGKEVGPSDFDDLMCWHQQRVLRGGFRPRVFSYPIQQPGMSAEGHLSIETRLGQELRSFASCRPALRPMKLPINASVNVLLKGDRFLHGAIMSCFAEQPEPMTLEARVRQFGCVVLVLGTIASVDSFSPTAALVLRGDETLRIPLLLEALPTAKEFRDATGSLSPEQRRFAEAVRAMQLASTVFGICVIPVKPQLEKLLGLPKGSLTQEVKLTQDIIELLIQYNIPSSHIRYSGSPSADREAKVTAVKEDVRGLRSMIEEERQRELEEQKRLQRERELRAKLQEEREMLARARREAHGRQVDETIALWLTGPNQARTLSLLKQFTGDACLEHQFAGVSCKQDTLYLDGKTVQLQLFEAGYTDRARQGLKHGVILTVDLSDAGSVAQLHGICAEIKRFIPRDMPVLLVSMQVDAEGGESPEAIRRLAMVRKVAAHHHIESSETSAQGLGVVPAFFKAIRATLSYQGKLRERSSELDELCERATTLKCQQLYSASSLTQSMSTSRGLFGGLFSSGFSTYSSRGAVECSNLSASLDSAQPRLKADQRRVLLCSTSRSSAMSRDDVCRDRDRREPIEALEAKISQLKDLSRGTGFAKEVQPQPSVLQDAADDCFEQEPHIESVEDPPQHGGQAAESQEASEVAAQGEPDASSDPSAERSAQEGREPEGASAEAIDYTSIPAMLDKRCDELGGGAALRPVTIKAGSEWKRRSKNLVGIAKEATLAAEQQREGRDSAFDLLDALTCSGSLSVEAASLHVVFLLAHCFEEALLDMLVQENVNPMEPVERSSLILASTIHGSSVEQLLQPAELPRVGQHSPALVAPEQREA